MYALLCMCFTQDCSGTAEKSCKSPQTKSSIAWPWHSYQRMELTWLQAPSCHSSAPCAAGGVWHPRDTGGPLFWQLFNQDLGGGKPAPWDKSCSHGRGLHQACANHIFSQIKCSSLVKFEHIPRTQDKSQPLFPPYLPNCFKGRILKQNKDKCFIFLYPHSWKELKFSPKI